MWGTLARCNFLRRCHSERSEESRRCHSGLCGLLRRTMTVWAARARSGSFAHARSPASAAYPRVAQDDKLGVWAAPCPKWESKKRPVPHDQPVGDRWVSPARKRWVGVEKKASSPKGGTEVSPLKRGSVSFLLPCPALTRWARTNVAASRLALPLPGAPHLPAFGRCGPVLALVPSAVPCGTELDPIRYPALTCRATFSRACGA